MLGTFVLLDQELYFSAANVLEVDFPLNKKTNDRAVSEK